MADPESAPFERGFARTAPARTARRRLTGRRCASRGGPRRATRALLVFGVSIFVLCAMPHWALASGLTELAERAARSVVKLEVLDARGREASSGTGFFVSADGRILTNDHVIDGASDVRAVLHDGRKVRTLGLLARDRERDLALLQAEGGEYAPLALGSSQRLRAGDEIVVLGSPRGFAGTLSAGIVSAVRRSGVDEGDGFGRYWKLQVTAPISPGSSGSPIMTRDGMVVAVAVGQTESGQALNFGVPIEDAQVLLAGVRPPSLVPWARAPAGRSLWLNLAISAAALATVLTLLATASRLAFRARKDTTRTARAFLE